jgi:transcription antitermination factor NusG
VEVDGEPREGVTSIFGRATPLELGFEDVERVK